MRQLGLYLIKKDFFTLINDKNLLYKDKRPHFFVLKDKKTDLIWMVPCTSNIEKWQQRINKLNPGKSYSDSVAIFSVLGQKQVLLFQNMFPCLEKYIDRPFTIHNEPGLIYNKSKIRFINRMAKQTILLLEKGVKLSKFPPDITKIKTLMLNELNNDLGLTLTPNRSPY